jgi:hypothetical protein
MVDEFDALVSKIAPSRHDILSRVDEYTLYRFYLGKDFVPGIAFPSPIRGDDKISSFSVFPAARGRGWDEFEFTWKDHGRGESGNIFKLVQRMYSLPSLEDAYALINQDFELDLNLPSIGEKIKLFTKPESYDIKIRVKSCEFTKKGKEFWNQFRIGPDLLKQYNTTQIEYYWSSPSQPCPTGVMDPTFAYRVGDAYQLYSPYAPRDKKFRNNLPESYFFGYQQLPPEGDLLIIDKSVKHVIFNRRLGYWAVCGRSETTRLPHHKVLELRVRFKRILLMLDPDPAGIESTEKYLQDYPWMEPKFLTQAKDKTDLCKLVGFDEAKTIIDKLIADE